MSNRKLFAVLTLFILTVTGVRAQEVFMVDKVVATVGNSSILYSELVYAIEQMQYNYRQQGIVSQRDPHAEALEQLILQKILYNQAQVDSLQVEYSYIMGEVQRKVDEEVAAMGGSIAAVEQKYGKPLYAIRADMLKQFEEMRYIQSMDRKIRDDVTISTKEVEKYYRSLPKDSLPTIPEQYSFSQITMLPPSKEMAELRVKQQLLGFKERILNGEKFESLAILYSKDKSASAGGEMTADRDGLVKSFGDALARLKPDQISEVVETEYGFHIIQLIEKQGNQYRFRHILLKPTYTTEEKITVINRLDTVANDIRSGKINFAEAALKYSDDKYSRNNGGKATNIELLMNTPGYTDAKYAQTYFFMEELMPAEQAQIRSLKMGEISDAFTTSDMWGNEVGKILRLDEILPAHEADLNADYSIVENMALGQKQQAEFLKWLDKKAATMYIRIDERFRDLDFNYDFLKR